MFRRFIMIANRRRRLKSYINSGVAFVIACMVVMVTFIHVTMIERPVLPNGDMKSVWNARRADDWAIEKSELSHDASMENVNLVQNKDDLDETSVSEDVRDDRVSTTDFTSATDGVAPKIERLQQMQLDLYRRLQRKDKYLHLHHKQQPRPWDPGAEAPKSYLAESKPEKVVLSPGCPKRGAGSHVTNMAFAKVHKSASTTIANILARYALRYSLNVALPNKVPGVPKFNYFEQLLPEQVYPVPHGQTYNVIFNHMIFNRPQLERIMPNDTFYLAIIRSPEERLVSSILYYRLAESLWQKLGVRVGGPREALLYIARRPRLLASRPEVYNSFASNTGLAQGLHRNPAAVQAHVAALEEDLSLVLVVEYFDESLVLLRRRACLAMRDIVYVKKNNARSQNASSFPFTLTHKERQELADYQMADELLYDHFHRRFWQLVHQEDASFFDEVRHFRKICRTVKDFCDSRSTGHGAVVAVEASPWNEEFLVTSAECRLMVMPELKMQVLLVERAARLLELGRAGTQHWLLPAEG